VRIQLGSDTPPLEVEERELIGVFQPPKVQAAADQGAMVRQALASPIGSERLADLARGKKRIVILCDDNTRSTRVDLLLPEVLKELALGGAKEEQITILLALGTHRAMTQSEIDERLGREVARRLRVVNHDWKNRSALADLGRTEHDTPIEVNRLALEADLLIGLGHVVPHRVAGYSAGGKIVQPGISGEATTGCTHWLSAQYSLFDMLGRCENPVRAEIDAVAERVGLAFIVNTIQDAQGHLLGVFAGHPVRAHRAAARLAETVSTATAPALADIVVAHAWPADLDMWQAVKALFTAAQAVKRGGVIVLVAACREGVAYQHPEVLRFGYRPVAEVRALQAAGQIADLSAAAHLAHGGEVVAEWARCVLVSEGIGEADARRLGFSWAASVQDGFAVARRLADRSSPTVVILKNASEMMIRIGGA